MRDVVVVGKYGNNQMYPLASKVVEGGNASLWKWFLEKLFTDLCHPMAIGLTLMLDQQKRVGAYRDSLLQCCMCHVYDEKNPEAFVSPWNKIRVLVRPSCKYNNPIRSYYTAGKEELNKDPHLFNHSNGVYKIFSTNHSPIFDMMILFLQPMVSSGNHTFLIKEATVQDLQLAFEKNQLTSRQLVEFYMGEIHRLNELLRAVMEVNPDALYQANKADRAQG
ncbi:hypothetical protein PVK06_004590 [Gossypium arboreum]|uniref:Uncharacterized protein n=1 Tax=Gossypium arboreum TaxID=29729 RepID=A0ABR0QTD3_GOSAR|nr:hypothetical protein PVK06_004590 [Gossypium arboreum]